MAGTAQARAAGPSWNFVTNHALVLACLAADQHLRMRDVAERLGLSERSVQKIIADLEQAGFVTHTRDGGGRRNLYSLHLDRPLAASAFGVNLQRLVSVLR